MTSVRDRCRVLYLPYRDAGHSSFFTFSSSHPPFLKPVGALARDAPSHSIPCVGFLKYFIYARLVNADCNSAHNARHTKVITLHVHAQQSNPKVRTLVLLLVHVTVYYVIVFFLALLLFGWT